MNWIAQTYKQLSKSSNHWWYLPLMALLAAVDLFIAIIPTDALVVSTVLMKPKRWLGASVVFATGSALGAWLLGWLCDHFGEALVEKLFPHLTQSQDWARMADFLNHHGAPALALVAASPLPQQPAVALCALTHMDLSNLFLAVWVGRAAKYILFAYIASHAPKLLKKFKIPSMGRG